MRKGQTSAETITVFSISMLIVLLFLVLGLGMINDSAKLQGENDAYQATHDLASAADEVFGQGEGASKIVQIRLSSMTNFSANETYIGKPASASAGAESRTIMIDYGTGEKSAAAQEPLIGSFPSTQGLYRMKVASQGSYVSIYPSIVDLGKSSISVNMGQNDSRVVILDFYQVSRESVNVTMLSNWGISAVGCTLNQSSFIAGSSGNSASATFLSGSNASGIYASSITINATGVETNTSEIISIPIVVFVQAG